MLQRVLRTRQLRDTVETGIGRSFLSPADLGRALGHAKYPRTDVGCLFVTVKRPTSGTRRKVADGEGAKSAGFCSDFDVG